MKEYKITYQFSDVIDNIEAENEEEAKKIANERLVSDSSPKIDTYCFYFDIEEIK